MKVAYAIRLGYMNDDIAALFEDINKRLRAGRAVTMRGAARRIWPASYAICVETAVELWAFLIGPIMLIFSGMVSAMIWQTMTLAAWLVGLGSIFMALAFMSMAPGVHRLMLRVTLRRLTGRWVSVKPATADAMARLAYGKV